MDNKENKKNKEIMSLILNGVLFVGGVALASTSPYFVDRVLSRVVRKSIYDWKNKRNHKKFQNSFYYLKKRGLIAVSRKRGQIFISLTEEGKKRAGRYQIDELKIKKSKQWDKLWWVLIFDIEDKHKIKREALRGKIKQLGMFQLQKSVWVYPYDFQKEVGLLRDFFGLGKEELKIMVVSKIEDDQNVRKFFRLG